MGIRNYLIEGVSGAGKTTVAEELERRGYHVIHGDRLLAYIGDPETGEPLAGPPPGLADPVAWSYARWIWPVDTVKSLIADQSHSVTFFCGGCRNLRHFIALFDGVFILDVDADTLRRRLESRPDDEFGGKPEEQALVLRVHATREGLPNGLGIDASAPLASVVDDILGLSGDTA